MSAHRADAVFGYRELKGKFPAVVPPRDDLADNEPEPFRFRGKGLDIEEDLPFLFEGRLQTGGCCVAAGKKCNRDEKKAQARLMGFLAQVCIGSITGRNCPPAADSNLCLSLCSRRCRRRPKAAAAGTGTFPGASKGRCEKSDSRPKN